MRTQRPIVLPLAARSQEHDDWGYIRDANKRVVAIARYDQELTDVALDEYRRTGKDPSEAAMTLIVRAVNAHDDLIRACKEAALVIAETAKATGADPLKGTCLPRLLAAIKLAEA